MWWTSKSERPAGCPVLRLAQRFERYIRERKLHRPIAESPGGNTVQATLAAITRNRKTEGALSKPVEYLETMTAGWHVTAPAPKTQASFLLPGCGRCQYAQSV